MLNKFRTWLMPLLISLQSQLEANKRLRWMVWCVAYILVFYVGLVFNDWRQERAEQIQLLSKTSRKLDQLEHQTQWPARWAQEKKAGETLRARLWQAQSESFAEADVQNYLRKLMTSHNALNYRPRLAPSERMVVGGETLIKVTAEVSGAVGVDQIDHLLKAIADSTKILEIQRFSYGAQRAGQLDMMVSAYFAIVASEAPVDAQPDVQSSTPEPMPQGGSAAKVKAEKEGGENVVR